MERKQCNGGAASRSIDSAVDNRENTSCQKNGICLGTLSNDVMESEGQDCCCRIGEVTGIESQGSLLGNSCHHTIGPNLLENEKGSRSRLLQSGLEVLYLVLALYFRVEVCLYA